MREILITTREYLNYLPNLNSDNLLIISSTFDQLLTELRNLLFHYNKLLMDYKKLQALKDSTSQIKEKIRRIYERLIKTQNELSKITPKMEKSELSALDIINLARQFPLTQHSIPSDNQIINSFLRYMPFSSTDRLPMPEIEQEGISETTKSAKVSLIFPEKLPEEYRKNAYIRYTTDGTIPTCKNGFIYNRDNPPEITENTSIMAVLCHPGKYDSEIVRRDYMLDENAKPILTREGMVRDKAINFITTVHISDTPSGESQRPGSTDPYKMPSIHASNSARQPSVYQSSSPDDIF